MDGRIVGSMATILVGLASAAGAGVEPRPFAVPAALPDRADTLSPGQVHLDGWLGARLDANAKVRLLTVDTEPFLAGFRKKPGTHPWIGEHVGKWLHAATLAWAYSGDPTLRQKLDRVAADLVAAQESDGYLGTYPPDRRFGLYDGADWDVWSHKYCLIGLLTYHRYTGDPAALAACKKAADLLIATFPARRSILQAGTHVGMAATSVLEPVVVLYRVTGDRRYLDFARYIVRSWDEPGGPAILASLRTSGSVRKVANAKAYEMLSNLVGLCELARATGDRTYLDPVVDAWADVVSKRLYLTGSASAGELFTDDHVLPNGPGAHLGETCVTTTWLQLNLQLLRLTGDAKYGDEIERSVYNHLTAAQHPRGDDWCYYTPLEGTKSYDAGITCCHSSGPRGLALAPETVYLRGVERQGEVGHETLLVSTFETSRAALSIGGTDVTVMQQSGFPREGRSALKIGTKGRPRFAVAVRVPPWAEPVRLSHAGKSSEATSGWVRLPEQDWADGDVIDVTFGLGARRVTGEHGNQGRAALTWGPFVLAFDSTLNPGLPSPAAIGLLEESPAATLRPGSPLRFETHVVGRAGKQPATAVLSTFADAGSSGGTYRVWLRGPGVSTGAGGSLLLDGEEARSRSGNLDGSVCDGDPDTPVVTFDNTRAGEDWYAVSLPAPAEVGRVVFRHGRTFHDGGWFDTAAGKPKVQVRRSPGAAWETVATLDGYPATTATNAAGLKPGQAFSVRWSPTVRAVAVRVVGTPAHGDNPRQAFSSCGELEAYRD